MSGPTEPAAAAPGWSNSAGPAPTVEEVVNAVMDRNAAALARIDQIVAAMAKRPGAWGGAGAIEVAARVAMELRATLLGGTRDEPPGRPGSVLGRLIHERFGETSACASSFLTDEASGPGSIGDFLTEWYRREQVRVPDRARDLV